MQCTGGVQELCWSEVCISAVCAQCMSLCSDKHPGAGREKFVDEVHKWVEDKGGKILQQLRRLGASPDWSRQAYTMSPQLSKAVLEAFLQMHAKGLIYRDNRLVNWDTRLQSAVSDIEVRQRQNSSAHVTHQGRCQAQAQGNDINHGARILLSLSGICSTAAT